MKLKQKKNFLKKQQAIQKEDEIKLINDDINLATNDEEFKLSVQSTHSIKYLISSILQSINDPNFHIFLGGRALIELLSDHLSVYFHGASNAHNYRNCPICLGELESKEVVKDLDIYFYTNESRRTDSTTVITCIKQALNETDWTLKEMKRQGPDVSTYYYCIIDISI